MNLRTFVRVSLCAFVLAQPAHLLAMKADWDYVEASLSADPGGKTLNLPPYVGGALAEFQNSGDTLKDSNWMAWVEKGERDDGKPTIKPDHKTGESQVPGKACDFWNLYKKDCDLMQDFGFNLCRFSLDWSMVQPKAPTRDKDNFDEKAIAHYHDVIDSMLERGLEPMVTLHHFTHPQWWEEMGAFEKYENLVHFRKFAVRMFDEFAGKVKLWCTINEPGCYYFQAYINGEFAPAYTLQTGGKRKFTENLERAADVLGNILKAHIHVYSDLKYLQKDRTFLRTHKGAEEAKIGMVHQYMTFRSYHQNDRKWVITALPAEVLPAKFMTYCFNDVIMRFLKTGKFSFRYSPLMTAEFEVRYFKKPSDINDFIGLNYYSRPVITQSSLTKVEPLHLPDQVMTDMTYPMDPEGFEIALRDAASLEIPVYVTENGVSDRHDSINEGDSSDTRKLRDRWIKRHLYVVSELRNEGLPILSYIYWTPFTNFEWNDGYNCDFGLHAVDLKTQARTLRNGAKWFKGVLNAKKMNKGPILINERALDFKVQGG